MAEWLKVAVC